MSNRLNSILILRSLLIVAVQNSRSLGEIVEAQKAAKLGKMKKDSTKMGKHGGDRKGSEIG